MQLYAYASWSPMCWRARPLLHEQLHAVRQVWAARCVLAVPVHQTALPHGEYVLMSRLAFASCSWQRASVRNEAELS